MKNFWDKVAILAENECWVWTAAKYRNGYGAFRIPKAVDYPAKMTTAHRFSFMLANGFDSIPIDYVVCHTCDNPCCVNPHHLFVGTQLDNILDKITKERYCKRPNRYQRGEANQFAKLSEEQVVRARKLYSDGLSIAEIAKLLDIDRRNLWAIVHRKSWTHI